MTPNNQLKPPAIALIVSGGILALIALFTTFMAFSMPQGGMFMGDDGAVKYMMMRALVLVLGVILLIASGCAIFGGISMLKQGNYAWSMAGSICAIVGGVLIGLPGWLFVVPCGIWGIVALRKTRTMSDPPAVPVQPE